MVENIKKVLEAATMLTRICANPQRGAYVWTEWLTWVTDALGVWFAPSWCTKRTSVKTVIEETLIIISMIMTIIILWWGLAVNISRGWYSYPLLLIRTQNVGFCEWIKENQYNYNSVLIVRKYIIYSNFLSKKYTIRSLFLSF